MCIMSSLIEESMKYHDTMLTLTAFESLYCFRFRPRPYLFERDHKFPTGNENLPVIILYAEIGTREFAEFHRVLSKKSKNGKILYVLRHYIKVHALCCYWFFGLFVYQY